MTNRRHTWSATLITFLVAFLACRVALAVDETELTDPTQRNDPAVNAQAIFPDSNSTLAINGSILNTIVPAHRDVDFYSFQAQKGETYTFNIDGGMKDAYSTGVATDLALFGPVNDQTLMADKSVPEPIAQSSSGVPIDSPGSVSAYDARIEDFLIPATGRYIIGVTSYPASFTDINTLYAGGTLYQTSPYAGIPGTYTLLVSFSKPALQSINIDIRPGRRDVIWSDLAVREYSGHGRGFDRDGDHDRRHRFEGLRHRFKHGLPVALLSSDSFDATNVDQSSLKFGATGDEDSFIRCSRRSVDVNQDKLPDLVCWFDFTKSDFVPGDNQGVLTGSTNAGDAFEGKGWLKIVTGRRNLRDYDRLLDRGRRHRDHDRDRHHDHRHR